MPKTIFLDTNIFLHYQDIDQIDWLNILKTDLVKIILPPVIIRELNKNKDNNLKARVRKRAASVLKKLSALFQGETQAFLRDGVEIYLEGRDPLIDFTSYQLNREVQDDHLMASMIAYRNEMPDEEIILITSDNGLTLLAKAKLFGISTIKLSDDVKLPVEIDPEQERINQLEQEIRQIKMTIPKLSLVYEAGNQFINFTLPIPNILNNEEIDRNLDEIRNRNPRLEQSHINSKLEKNDDGDDSAEDKLTLADLMGKIGPSIRNVINPEEILEYNNDLENFYNDYKAYLLTQVEYENLRRRTIKISIWLANNGTLPAEDIDIIMHFPDGFDLLKEEDLPKPPKPPVPPSPPMSQMERLFDHNNLWRDSLISPHFNLPHDFNRVEPPPNVSAPRIRRTNSYDVNIHILRVKHLLKVKFDELFIMFKSYEDAQSFHVNYEILAANLPQKTEGSLHIIIKKDSV
jgi:hypothetical protein